MNIRNCNVSTWKCYENNWGRMSNQTNIHNVVNLFIVHIPGKTSDAFPFGYLFPAHFQTKILIRIINDERKTKTASRVQKPSCNTKRFSQNASLVKIYTVNPIKRKVKLSAIKRRTHQSNRRNSILNPSPVALSHSSSTSCPAELA